jgi:uncharacterized membrane protein YgdD (TMEM256/DUF423 family)
MSITNIWIRVAGISGASAVLLGAYGAHAMMKADDGMKETWKVASQYHFMHTIALTMSAMYFTGKKRNYVCSLFTLGMVLFSGTCYTIVLINQKKPLNQVAPVGGILLTCGWLALALM